MKLQLYYNKWPVAALAKEMRRLGWAVALAAVGSDYLGRGLLSYAVAAIVWVSLQAAALLVESVRLTLDPEDEEDRHAQSK